MAKLMTAALRIFLPISNTLYNPVSYDPSELRKIHDTVDAIILEKVKNRILQLLMT